MPSTLVVTVAVLSASYFFLRALLRLTQDGREPPALATTVPFMSPLVGMLARGPAFFNGLRDRYDLPIYTLRLPGTRLYIVNSTALIMAVQRQWRSISFAPVQVQMSATLMGLSKEGVQEVGRDQTEDHGFLNGLSKLIHQSLGVGPGLDAMNRTSVRVIATSLDRLAAQEGSISVNMLDWIRGEIIMASTEGVYGPRNPFRDESVRTAFGTYEGGIIPLALNIHAAFVSKEAFQAREHLNKAYERYFAEGGHTHPEASVFIKNRAVYYTEHGISPADHAKIEAATSIGLLSNTMPTAFWVVYHVFSDPTLLQECRRELCAAVQEKDGVCTLDLAVVRNACPVLLSTFQEVFRFYGISVGVRIVQEDYMLEGKYLLKKGSTVIIPGSVQHTLRSVWGDAVDSFDYKRFIPEQGSKRPKRYNPTAFRPFGGGTTLCPGRHFAATETLVFCALFVLRFDAKPSTASGQWPPLKAKSVMGTAVQLPAQDVKIEIKRRDDRKWHIFFSDAGSDKPMAISAEDIAGDDKQ